MAEMNKTWQKIERADHVQEYFWQGEFIQSDTWSETSPPQFQKRTYPYLKDGLDYYNKRYTFGNEIHVAEMTHATPFECMCSIIEEGGFRSQEKLCPGIGSMSLVWFGSKIGEREIDCMKENRKRSVHDLMQNKPELNADSVLRQIARTPAFQPISLYGHFKFTIGIQEVMNAYKIQFCYNSRYPEMRKLGTFAYKQEIMHAILVCPPNTPGTYLCPLLNDDPVIQHDDTLQTWTWKPHSTGTEYLYFNGYRNPLSRYIRWEHVCFAFYVPNGSCLSIPNLERCVSLCLKRKKSGEISGVNEGIRMMLHWIESTKVTNRKSVADMLISMIAGYLKDERLYEKTMVDPLSVETRCVRLATVVECARELLQPWEFKALDWAPLTDWMNSLTRHSNVIHDIQQAKIRL